MIIICIYNNIYRKKMKCKINKYIFNIIKEVHYVWKININLNNNRINKERKKKTCRISN